VVAVNVGDAVERVRQHAANAGAAFANLLDPKGEFLAKAAKDRQLPRVFLVDGQGKILWFDVEYSRTTRHDLLQAIEVTLAQK
jgi:hypothetical protein